jgi:hypothetical protein
MAKDETYNQIKRQLAELHRKGFEFYLPCTEEAYIEETKEHYQYIQIGASKKIKRIPKGLA